MHAACPPRDTTVSARYPVDGVFLYPSSDRCVTQGKVERIHKLGGNTLVTFGPRLKPITGEVAGCVDEGKGCVQRARELIGGRTLRYIYTYLPQDHFGGGLLRCASTGLDRRIESNGKVFYRLLLPAGAPTSTSCSLQGTAYDVVIIDAGPIGGAGAISNLVAEASAYGMKVYAGLPMAPVDADATWAPDLAHLPAVRGVTDRVLSDYASRYPSGSALGGVYQAQETVLADYAAGHPTIQLYSAQHAIVAQRLAGRRIVVSPYLQSNKFAPDGSGGFVPHTTKSPSEATQGFREIAATRAGAPMAIAPQDGRGTGAGATYYPNELNVLVDPALRLVVGQRTYGEAYVAPTRDYFSAMAAAVGEFTNVELWMNAEAMEPGRIAGLNEYCDPPGTTTPKRASKHKSQLDEQLARGSVYTTKVISYMWDAGFVCQNEQDTTLENEIAAKIRQPIVANGFRWTNNGTVGLAIHGYNLGSGTINLLWYAAGGVEKRASVAVNSAGAFNPNFGNDTPDRKPALLQSTWVPFTAPDLSTGWPYVYISVTVPGNGTSGTYITAW